MTRARRPTNWIASAPALLALAALAGCGSSGQGSTSAATSAPATTTAAAPAVAAPAQLSILTPRANARTGSTVAVHVTVTGAAAGATPRLRYELDRRPGQLGSTRLTLHNLTPGRHRLQVLLSGGRAARATTTFVVRAPTPVVRSAPAPTTPTVSTPAPATTTTPTTAPARTTPAPRPAPKPKKTTPAPSGGIPQNGGGDGDSDNSGGPSDGDGNL